jgi:hypothetical protein
MQGSWTFEGFPASWVWADVGYTIYAAMENGSVYMSTDYGTTWTEAAAAIDGVEPIRSIFVYGSTKLIIATDTHIKISIDGGHTWENDMGGILVTGEFYQLSNPYGDVFYLTYSDAGIPVLSNYTKTYS